MVGIVFFCLLLTLVLDNLQSFEPGVGFIRPVEIWGRLRSATAGRVTLKGGCRKHPFFADRLDQVLMLSASAFVLLQNSASGKEKSYFGTVAAFFVGWEHQ